MKQICHNFSPHESGSVWNLNVFVLFFLRKNLNNVEICETSAGVSVSKARHYAWEMADLSTVGEEPKTQQHDNESS